MTICPECKKKFVGAVYFLDFDIDKGMCFECLNKKPINLGWCPRCKSDFPMMTKVIDGVVFCHLCGCDLMEIRSERLYWVQFAKNYAEEMM